MEGTEEMARFTAYRRTATLKIPVASLAFEGEGTTAEFEGAAKVISDASYYLGGPAGGIAEAPHVSIVEHGQGPRGGTIVAHFDLRTHVFAPTQAKP